VQRRGKTKKKKKKEKERRKKRKKKGRERVEEKNPVYTIRNFEKIEKQAQ